MNEDHTKDAGPTPVRADAMVTAMMPDVARRISDMLHTVAGEEYGFALVAFPLGRPGNARYVSNADEKDVAPMFQEIIRTWSTGERPQLVPAENGGESDDH